MTRNSVKISFVRDMPFHAWRIFSVFVLLASFSWAEDRPAPVVFQEIALADGRTFAHAELKTFGASGVVVKHDNGLTQVAYTLLPENVRSKVASQIADAIATAKASTAAKRPASEIVDPAASVRAKAAPGEILLNGRCFIFSGNQQQGLAQVEVRVYPANEFSKVVDEIEKRVNPRWMELEEGKMQAEARHDQGAKAQAQKDQQALAFSKWDQLPAPVATAKTDQDGRFSLNHRLKGEYLIFARSPLKTGADTRNYVWIVSSRMIADSSRVFLTTDNAL
jgi:hypothetical protein